MLLGLATAPTLAYYASADPQALWEAGGATALFILFQHHAEFAADVNALLSEQVHSGADGES